MRNLMIASCTIAAFAASAIATARPHAQAVAPAAGAAQAPNPDVPISFEVASIRPSDPATATGTSIRRQPGGRFSTNNVPVRMMITFAYQIQSFQLVDGPDWIANDRFDIVAKMEGDPQPVAPGSGPDHMMLALRTLLADRFKLAVHRETRELDIYALTMARAGGKPGPALKPASGDCSPEALAARRAAPPQAGAAPLMCGIQMSMGRIRLNGFPLSLFASAISNQVGRFVVDRTGLTGNWEFELTFAPETRGGLSAGPEPPPADLTAPNLFTAVQEQLGLKFESTKGPVEVLVIDSIQQPTPD